MKLFVIPLVLALSVAVAKSQSASPHWFPQDTLPPASGEYVSPQQWHQLYTNGIIISNVIHRRFTQGLPPPPPGTQQVHSFGSMVELSVSTDGGVTFQRLEAPAQVSARVTHAGGTGDTRLFDTEMLQLDVAGGGLPPGVMLRESPTRASTGQTTIRTLAAGGGGSSGGCVISSFFDIFTEISLDGGQTWSPASAPATMQLQTDPRAIPPVVAPRPAWPPPMGVLECTDTPLLSLTMSYVARKFHAVRMTASVTPPPEGGSTTCVCSLQADLDLSADGGATFQPVRVPASATMSLVHRATAPDGVATYDTEMLALDLAGGGLPAGVMIRESPTLPSRGGTSMRAMPDGQYQVSSFFDIFTEVSLDDGQTWTPAADASRVVLGLAAPPFHFPDPSLPPPTGEYASPADWHAAYAQGIIISNVIHRQFTQSFPPPPPGQQQVHSFGSLVQCDVSADGGATFQPMTIPAQVTVLIQHTQTDGGTRYFDTEMLQLDLAGGGLPPGVMIRESPTKASVGRTCMTQLPNGQWRISSFFDIFTELSVDGGQNWSPALTRPGPMTLRDPLEETIHIVCPDAIAVTSSVPAGVAVTYVALAAGGCDAVPGIVCTPPSGSVFPIGTTTVTCVATDSCGQTATCQFTVTVTRQRPKPWWFPQDFLPPALGEYVSPRHVQQIYTNFFTNRTLVVSNMIARRFSQGAVPPLPGTTNVHGFTSVIELSLSTDGGMTFERFEAPAQVSVRVAHAGGTGDTSLYDTEMLQLDVAGGGLPPGVMLRESPTRASTGRTSVRAASGGGGGYMIGSFFDIFTEISLDGGQTWDVSLEPVTMDLQTDPRTIPPIVAPRPGWPPPMGLLASTQLPFLSLSNGVALRNVRCVRATSSVPPPPEGSAAVCACDLEVDLDLSLDGGLTFQTVRAPASAEMGLVHRATAPDGTATYDTEMLALSLQGGGLPGGIRVRESPTRPSLGGCALRPRPDGQFQVSSFFDIFTEVSLDGGQTWTPAEDPSRLELGLAAPPFHFPDPNLPPLTGEYVSPADWHAAYAQGIVISNVIHRQFTQSFPPPPPGTQTVHSFGSVVECDVSADGGATFQPMTIPALVTVRIRELQADNGTRYFDTEMLQLDLSGGGLPPGVMIRESPTKASVGRTCMTQLPNGQWRISSFFDIFTELSVDGGQNWSPALTRPGPMTLRDPLEETIHIVCPDDIAVTSSVPGGVAVTYVALAAGGCDAVPGLVCTPPSGSVFPIGTTTVTCVATDSCGQSATCQFTVTVTRRPPAPWWFPNDLLPPPPGEYVSPERWHQLYANGIVISNVIHRRFTQGLPPPPPGGQQVHSFGSMVELSVSADGGVTFQRLEAPAQVSVRVAHAGGTGDTSLYDTEMLQLDVSGGGLPPGVMLRESPTRASTGKTSIRAASGGGGGGGSMIDSFFDIFTEISLDGGQTWSPALEPATMELQTDPRAIPPVVAPSPAWPPPMGLLASTQSPFLALPNGVVLRNVRCVRPTSSVPPPPEGSSATCACDLEVDCDLSTDGGQTFQAVRAPASAVMSLAHRATAPDGTATYDTEMLALSLQGGGLPAGIRVRESPTLPTRGGASLAARPDGQYHVSSFFDIFTEVSLDDGQTWTPAADPSRLELGLAAAPTNFPGPDLPPLTGEYVSPADWHAAYAQGVIISNVIHRQFTQSFPPPPAGATEVHSFGSQVRCDVSMDGGKTFQPMTIPAQVTVSIRELQADNGTRYFDTEMLQLDLSGGGLPPAARVRESPTKASLGRTCLTQLPNGQWRISSFFDIFTELSVDGGQNWLPSSTSPGSMQLTTNPDAIEVDYFADTVARLDLQLPSGGSESVLLRGPATVHVYFEGGAEGVAHDDSGDGRDEVEADMVALALTGSSATLGPVSVRLRPGMPARGVIAEQANLTLGTLDVPPFATTGRADSFFDVFFDIQVAGQTLHHASAERLAAQIGRKPALPGDQYERPPGPPATLLDENNNPTGFALTGLAQVPVPDCGRLVIQPSSSNRVMICWDPLVAPGCALERAGILAPPAPWDPLASTPVMSNGRWCVFLPAAPSSTYYRLLSNQR